MCCVVIETLIKHVWSQELTWVYKDNPGHTWTQQNEPQWLREAFMMLMVLSINFHTWGSGARVEESNQHTDLGERSFQ